MGLKIAVIGGGSSYTPELFADLAEETSRLDVEQVVLMDPNGDRAAFVAAVSEGLVRAGGQSIQVTGTSSLDEAVAGADFVLLQIRVGGLAARVRDEHIPMEMDMVAGMAMTMRVGTGWGTTVHVPRFAIGLGMAFVRVRMHLTFGTAE